MNKKIRKSPPRIIVVVSEDSKKKFKMKCVKNNTTHQEVLKDFVDNYLRS